jgi:transcription elongation factor GreA
MSNIDYFTKEGLQKLKDEVNFLERVERPRISKEIGEAIDKGDLSENAEYHASKEEQGLMEGRLVKLKNQLANARLIDDSKIDASKALILSTVTIKNIKNKMEISYTLVAEQEADLKLKRISINSPIGKGLMGKTIGDIAEIVTPGGKMEFEIINITR